MRTFRRTGTLALLFTFIFLFNSWTAFADNDSSSQPWIRVVIVTDATSLSITSSGPTCVNRLMTTETVQSFDSGHTYSFDISSGQARLNGYGADPSGFSIIQNDDSGRFTCNGKSYRGLMRVLVRDGKLICVNVIQIEEYLWGVVPAEVPSNWPVEAIRAQAVAARTYALRVLMQYPDRPFDVYSTVLDQVYNGASGETTSTTSACNDTWGIVCTYDGLPIIAYYHAASGGWTASGLEMFGRNLPYLRSVPSRDSTINRWIYRISTSSLAAALRTIGIQVGNIQRVFVHRFSSEGRADEVKIIHSGGVSIVSGADLRRALDPQNLESTYFTVEGQEAPAIPDENSHVETQPAFLSDDVESYSLVNPRIYVPYPVPSGIDMCSVASAGTTTTPGTLTVIGSDGEFHYTAGTIWIAQPVRVFDLTINAIGGEFSFTQIIPQGSDTGTSADTETVEDPGTGVGNPSNGSIIFVGHGSGHGVGMSQHGARVLAENGWTYDSILSYFYSGIELVRFW